MHPIETWNENNHHIFLNAPHAQIYELYNILIRYMKNIENLANHSHIRLLTDLSQHVLLEFPEMRMSNNLCDLKFKRYSFSFLMRIFPFHNYNYNTKERCYFQIGKRFRDDLIPFTFTVEPVTETKLSSKYKRKTYIEHIKTFKQLLGDLELIQVKIYMEFFKPNIYPHMSFVFNRFIHIA